METLLIKIKISMMTEITILKIDAISVSKSKYNRIESIIPKIEFISNKYIFFSLK